MYIYTVGQGTPEGTDYQLILQHEEKFTNEQVQEICEQALVDTLNKMCETEPFIALSCIDSRILCEMLKLKGFQRVQITSHYYLEPYWNKDDIKNPGLLEWANGKTKGFAKNLPNRIKKVNNMDVWLSWSERPVHIEEIASPNLATSTILRRILYVQR